MKTDKNIIAERCRSIAEQYTDKLILCSDPLRPLWNREAKLFSKPPRWNYIDSVMIAAVLGLGMMRVDRRLTDYACRFTDAYVMPDGTIPSMEPEDFNLDNIAGGRNLLRLYKLTGEDRYRLGADFLYTQQLLRQPRLTCGSFWHKAIYPRQIWLDGAYMALPFLTEYGLMTGDRTVISDALRQLGNIRCLMKDERTGLYRHGYDETGAQLWADRTTGLSPEIWLRSVGWLCAALADMAELLPDSLLCHDMLSELLVAISQYIRDGMLYQLPVRPDAEGNYPETSGTLLVAYASLKASRLGIADASEQGFELLDSVSRDYISSGAGAPVLRNICLMGGLGGETERDGSAEYYLSEPVVENDAKGIAPFLMACTEAEKLLATSSDN